MTRSFEPESLTDATSNDGNCPADWEKTSAGSAVKTNGANLVLNRYLRNTFRPAPLIIRPFGELALRLNGLPAASRVAFTDVGKRGTIPLPYTQSDYAETK